MHFGMECGDGGPDISESRRPLCDGVLTYLAGGRGVPSLALGVSKVAAGEGGGHIG